MSKNILITIPNVHSKGLIAFRHLIFVSELGLVFNKGDFLDLCGTCMTEPNFYTSFFI